MRIASRIRQLRLEHTLSLEDLATRAKMPASLLESIENGQEVPTLDIMERLAGAMGMMGGLFSGDLSAEATPWLTPRLTMQQLANESFGSFSSASALFPKAQGFRAAIRQFLAFFEISGRRHKAKTPPIATLPLNSTQQNPQAGGKKEMR